MKNFREVCGRKFHETLMQLQRSNALILFMRWWLLTKFTCLLTLCTLSRQTHLAVAGKQSSSVNDVIHYECMIDRTLHVRKISGIFPEKFRKVSDILFFRKSYNPSHHMSFLFWISCPIPEIFAIKVWSCRSMKLAQILRFWPPILWRGGPPEFLDLHYKAHLDCVVCDCVAKFHGDRPRELGDVVAKKNKKEKKHHG